MKNLKLLSFAVLAVAVMFGCRKEADTLGTIHVYDQENNPVEGVRVTVYGEGDPSQEIREGLAKGELFGETNSRGKVVFNLSQWYESGQSGFAVLNVEACYGMVNTDTMPLAPDSVFWFGDGVLKVVEETDNAADITAFPSTDGCDF